MVALIERVNAIKLGIPESRTLLARRAGSRKSVIYCQIVNYLAPRRVLFAELGVLVAWTMNPPWL